MSKKVKIGQESQEKQKGAFSGGGAFIVEFTVRKNSRQTSHRSVNNPNINTLIGSKAIVTIIFNKLM